MKSRKSTLSCSAGILLITLFAGTLPAQEKPPAADEQVKPSAVNHDTAGKEACLVCHAIGASPIIDVPIDHENRANVTCLWCHAADSPIRTMLPSKTPHISAAEETDCMGCHGPGANPEVTEIPPTHEGRGNATCMWCHVKVKGEGGGR